MAKAKKPRRRSGIRVTAWVTKEENEALKETVARYGVKSVGALMRGLPETMKTANALGIDYLAASVVAQTMQINQRALFLQNAELRRELGQDVEAAPPELFAQRSPRDLAIAVRGQIEAVAKCMALDAGRVFFPPVADERGEPIDGTVTVQFDGVTIDPGEYFQRAFEQVMEPLLPPVEGNTLDELAAESGLTVDAERESA